MMIDRRSAHKPVDADCEKMTQSKVLLVAKQAGSECVMFAGSQH